MKLIIGTDEAGYGPTLGPLTIGMTAWTVPDEMSAAAMRAELQDAVTSSAGDAMRLHLADSKDVHKPGDLAPLEHVARALLWIGHRAFPGSPTELLALLADRAPRECLADEPGVGGMAFTLPLSSSDTKSQDAAGRFAEACSAAGIQPVMQRLRVISPAEFNERVAESGTKGYLLTQATLDLVHQAVNAFPEVKSVEVYCDRHGGRRRYDEFLSNVFPDDFIFRIEETPVRSVYRFGNVDVTFRTKAEELLPVACSSLLAKYVREVLMHGINRFWCSHLPELKPTKGYPVDAARFLEQIRETQELLELEDDCLRRIR